MHLPLALFPDLRKPNLHCNFLKQDHPQILSVADEVRRSKLSNLFAELSDKSKLSNSSAELSNNKLSNPSVELSNNKLSNLSAKLSPLLFLLPKDLQLLKHLFTNASIPCSLS